MRWLLLSVLAAACTAPEHLPPRPGSGNPGGGVIVDRDGGTDDDGSLGTAWQIYGHVCRIEDVRYASRCTQDPDMSGITVKDIGDYAQALTSSTGQFTLELPIKPYAVLEAARGDAYLMPSLMRVERNDQYLSSASMPAVDAELWAALVASLDAEIPDGTGVVIAYLRSNDQAVEGGEVTNVSAAAGVYTYSPDGWTTGYVTDTTGTVLILGVPEPEIELTAIDGDGVARLVSGIPVQSGAITFATLDLTAE